MNQSTAILKKAGSHEPKARRGTSGLLSRLRPVLKERAEFIAAFLRRPGSVGAIAPSSPCLAKAVVDCYKFAGSDTVVELGPGTGAFTRRILTAIGKSTTFFALELDPEFARSLKTRFPGLTVYNDSAERIPEYLALHGKPKADMIVSGLPWASLPLQVQERVFNAVLNCLRPGGVFTAFGYVHARWFPNAKRFRRRLEQHFASVETSRVVWRNFPPAFIYRCVR